MAVHLMGIDYGTGGTKCCIINEQGDVKGFTFEEYPLIHERAGWSEHDTVGYWQTVCRLIKESIAQARIDPQNIKGGAVSSTLPSLVMVDKNHNPVERAYNLMNHRTVRGLAEAETATTPISIRRTQSASR